MYGYVYKINFGCPHKCYIGQHISPKFSENYYNKNNLNLQKQIDKYKSLYGEDWKKFIKVTCIAKCDTQKELDDKEYYAILDEQKRSINPITDIEICKIHHQQYGDISLIRRKY